MARDFIVINEAEEYGNKLKRCINAGQQFLDSIRDIKLEMDHNTDGVDYSDIAVLFGLSRGADSNDVVGNAAYNLTAGALAAADVFAIKAFIDQMG